jgi:hypothetical protein
MGPAAFHRPTAWKTHPTTGTKLLRRSRSRSPEHQQGPRTPSRDRKGQRSLSRLPASCPVAPVVRHPQRTGHNRPTMDRRCQSPGRPESASRNRTACGVARADCRLQSHHLPLRTKLGLRSLFFRCNRSRRLGKTRCDLLGRTATALGHSLPSPRTPLGRHLRKSTDR